MPLTQLDHFNVNPGDLEASRRFYVDVIGLAEGYRPPFHAPGAWLYLGGRPVVHLLVAPDGPAGPPGRLDHIAFLATDVADLVRRLRAHGHPYHVRRSERTGLFQVFVRDPDGVQLELTFPIEERLPPGDHPMLPEA
jgi:catechol 2,3-dioxygenase-like lactoylglutathione lyase family enzyme